jgi:uncharacterized repeat protein (TIGR01451 family)
MSARKAAAPERDGEAILSWTISEDLTVGGSFVRLRYATDLNDILLPTGTALDGEVEDHFLTIVAPSLAVAKSSNAPGDIWQIGEADAVYQFTVTNNGPVASGDPDSGPAPAGITVLDLLPDGILPNWTGTHTNAGWSCSFSGQLVTCTTDQLIAAAGQAGDTLQFAFPVQVTADAVGTAINHASVGGGRDPFNDGIPPTPGDSCTDGDHCAVYEVTVQSSPAMEVEKTVDQASIDAPGALAYTILVRNTGNVPLRNVQVSDTLPDGQPAVLSGPIGDNGNGQLDVDEAWTYTTSYDATQEDIDAGAVLVNRVAVTSDEVTTPVEDTAETAVSRTPGLSIEKTGAFDDANGDGQGQAGETILYSFLVENTGNVTLEDVTVNDPLLVGAGVSLDQGPQTLAPGASFTFTASYALTQDDVDAGRVENTATATGRNPDGDPVESPEDQEIVPLPGEPGLSLVKTGIFSDENGNGFGELGETISYSFLVENIGALTLTDVTVEDPLLTDAGVSLDQGPQTLAPGASFTFTATYTLTQEDLDAGEVVNTATATGNAPDGEPVVSPQRRVETPLPAAPGLAITKTGSWNDADGDGLAAAGETVAYSFLVENTGTVTLSDVTVNDPLLIAAGVSPDQAPQTLAPGAAFTVTATYVLTQDDVDAGRVDNAATATGAGPNGDPVESPESDTTAELPGAPALAILKTGVMEDTNGNGFSDAGDAIVYTFRVENTGNVTISDVIPVDPGPTFSGQPGEGTMGAFSPAAATLVPGAVQEFSARYTLAQADVDAATEAAREAAPPSGADALTDVFADGGSSWRN